MHARFHMGADFSNSEGYPFFLLNLKLHWNLIPLGFWNAHEELLYDFGERI